MIVCAGVRAIGMSAVRTPAANTGSPFLAPMTAADLDGVMALETAVYPFPWTRGNFIDSLAAGYVAQLLRDGRDARLLGYFVALAGVDEMHLLNITVAPDHRRQGLARSMMVALVARCRMLHAHRVWLEVRVSNDIALAVYQRFGFREQGVRPGYYPAAHGKRESAVVMSLEIDAERGRADGLD
jgi:ribosomal-protein-alanine N-acetyltransferase